MINIGQKIDPIFYAVRIIPRDEEFLDRKLGARGEIFYDRDANSLRLYDGQIAGGIGLSRSDLSNVALTTFREKSVDVEPVILQLTVFTKLRTEVSLIRCPYFYEFLLPKLNE